LVWLPPPGVGSSRERARLGGRREGVAFSRQLVAVKPLLAPAHSEDRKEG
jgi:hypothetical protein